MSLACSLPWNGCCSFALFGERVVGNEIRKMRPCMQGLQGVWGCGSCSQWDSKLLEVFRPRTGNIARISVHHTQYMVIHGRMDLKLEKMIHINFYEVNVFAPNYFRRPFIVFWYESLISLWGQGHLLICSWKCVHRWMLNYRHDREDMAEPVTILCQRPF